MSEYSLETEVEDALTVLRQFSDVRTLFGWSYGGLIARTRPTTSGCRM